MWLGVVGRLWPLAASWATRPSCEPAGMQSPGWATRPQEMCKEPSRDRGSGTAGRHPAAAGSALTGQALTSFGLTEIRRVACGLPARRLRPRRAVHALIRSSGAMIADWPGWSEPQS